MDGLDLGLRCVNKDGGGKTPLHESSCAAVGFYDPNSFAYNANINTALCRGSLRGGPLKAAAGRDAQLSALQRRDLPPCPCPPRLLAVLLKNVLSFSQTNNIHCLYLILHSKSHYSDCSEGPTLPKLCSVTKSGSLTRINKCNLVPR